MRWLPAAYHQQTAGPEPASRSVVSNTAAELSLDAHSYTIIAINSPCKKAAWPQHASVRQGPSRPVHKMAWKLCTQQAQQSLSCMLSIGLTSLRLMIFTATGTKADTREM